MQKQLVFVITAVVLLAAVTSVYLYNIHIANAQNNTTSAGGAKNGTTGSNMTGTAGNTTTAHSSSIPTAKPASGGGAGMGGAIFNNQGSLRNP